MPGGNKQPFWVLLGVIWIIAIVYFQQAFTFSKLTVEDPQKKCEMCSRLTKMTP